MAAKFRKGDLVQLKSGGPCMTVDNPEGYSGVDCVWFAGARREQAHFDPETLKPWEELEKLKK